MREIKFKAWDKKMNKMRIVESIGFGKPYYSHEGYPVVNMIGRDCINNKDIIIHRDSHQCELMQYTGLKDKNGKEIYEGDICKSFNNEYGDNVGLVKYSEETCSFDLHMKSKMKEIIYIGTDYNLVEVIGNIYENPELLEVEE